MIALSVAKLKMFSPESKIFLRIKPKKKKKNAKRQEMLFVMSLATSVLPQGVPQYRIFQSSLFSRVFRSYFVLQIFGV